MLIFFDCEFVEDGRTIELISIGMVRDDGKTYQAVSSEFDFAKAEAHPFVCKYVLPKLTPRNDWKPRAQIAEEIKQFVGDSPEFWADYAGYDWIALCQLYGTMMQLPSTWPMFCRDIQQLKDEYLPIELREPHDPHNALGDAWNVHDRYLQLYHGSSRSVPDTNWSLRMPCEDPMGNHWDKQMTAEELLIMLKSRFPNHPEMDSKRIAFFPEMGKTLASDLPPLLKEDNSQGVALSCPEIRIHSYFGRGSTESVAVENLKRDMDKSIRELDNLVLIRNAPKAERKFDPYTLTYRWEATARLGFGRLTENGGSFGQDNGG